MRVLVLNSGSSSLKFALLDVPEDGGEAPLRPIQELVLGKVEGIGRQGTFTLRGDFSASRDSFAQDHAQALHQVVEHLRGNHDPQGAGWFESVEAIGHRVVHGGEGFRTAVRIDDKVMAEIERLSELAPLHNPLSLAVLRGAQAIWPASLPMVAVFDTSFHRDLPEYAAAYALPGELAARHGVRRYGFHGIAFASAAAGYAALTGRPLAETRLVMLHLGNGCSAAAVREGRSVDTSMGFTPLEGLVMGTRSGDLDPAIIPYLARREGVDAAEVERWLNERSGLLGLSGRGQDMRDILRDADRGDQRAALAIDVFCYRARKYLGAYLAVLDGAEAVIFSGGIGEHQPAIRARICEGMAWCGLVLDPTRNAAVTTGAPARISRDGAALEAYVIPVDEEREIARETVACLEKVA